MSDEQKNELRRALEIIASLERDLERAKEALRYLANVNRSVRATGQDAREMASYARERLEELDDGTIQKQMWDHGEVM